MRSTQPRSTRRASSSRLWMGEWCMKDLINIGWIRAKGILFLLAGIISALLLLLEHPDLKSGLLLALSIWCFCRFYYFAFYVIEHYMDPAYKFSGLWSFFRYTLRRKRIR